MERVNRRHEVSRSSSSLNETFYTIECTEASVKSTIGQLYTIQTYPLQKPIPVIIKYKMITTVLLLVIIILLLIMIHIMSDQDEQPKIIKAVVPDSDRVQKNSSHVENVLFAPPGDDDDSDSESEKDS